MTIATIKPAHRRERLRPDYPVRVYRYDLARIIGDVPQGVWDTAKAMQSLWNELVAIFEAHEEKRRDIEEKEPRRALDAEMRLAIREAAKSHRDKLDNYCYYFVRDRMLESVSRYRSGKGGPPKQHHGLRKIVLPYKGNDGGRPISELFTGRYRRLSLRGTSGPTRGTFTCNGVDIPFEVKLHREMPEDGYVKMVTLSGRHVRPFGWEWAINVTIESPPRPPLPVKQRRTAALDLGWRVREDGLRIGTLLTEDGEAAELLLPFKASTRNSQRLSDRLAGRDLTPRLILDWRDLRTAQELSDCELDLTKARIAQYGVPGLARMRARGLEKLLREWRERGRPVEGIAELERWREQHYERWRSITHGRERLIARRGWLYSNLAHWLAEQYPRLIWEGDLSLKGMAEADTGDPVLENSQQYRHMASLYEFRRALKSAYDKHGGELVSERAAYTTVECAWCGGAIEAGPAVDLICENGHRSDQDVNAARVMLRRQGIALRVVTGFSAPVERSQIAGMVRPISA